MHILVCVCVCVCVCACARACVCFQSILYEQNFTQCQFLIGVRQIKIQRFLTRKLVAKYKKNNTHSDNLDIAGGRTGGIMAFPKSLM